MELKRNFKPIKWRDLPKDWQIKTIESVCSLVNGRGFKPFEWSENGLPIIRIQNLNGSDEFNYYHGSYDKKIQIEPYELLFAWSGSRGTSFGPHIWKGVKGVLNYHTWKVVVEEAKIDKIFFFYALRMLTKEIENNAHGASALVHTQKWVMEKLEFASPSTLEEQIAIASALSDMDALIAQTEKLIEKKKAIKQGLMQQLLSPYDVEGKLKKGWVKKKLGDICEIKKGQLITEATRIDGNVPVIAGGKSIAYYHNSANRIGKTITISGSGASAGYVSFHDYPIFASDCSTISESDTYSIEFIFNQLVLRQKAIYKLQTGGAQPHIHPSDITPLEIGIPKLEEQQRVAHLMNNINEEIKITESRRLKLQLLKQSMMQSLLTGKIRIYKPEHEPATPI